MNPGGIPIFRRTKLPAHAEDWPLRAWTAWRERRDELIGSGLDRATAQRQAAAEVRSAWEREGS